MPRKGYIAKREVLADPVYNSKVVTKLVNNVMEEKTVTQDFTSKAGGKVLKIAGKPGDKVMVSGPYGEFFIKPTDNEIVFVGGGAGMAPMRSHIFHLFHTEKTTRKVSFWYGARSLREVFYEDEFRAIEKEFPNFTFDVALSAPLPEDNWTGKTGFIHQVILDNYLKDHPNPEDIEYYICGPQVMSNAVICMLENLGVSREMIFFDDFGN